MKLRYGAAAWLVCVSAASGAATGDLESRIAAWLRPRTNSLSRPVYTYHYAMRGRIGLPASGPVPNGFSPQQYLQMKIARYLDLSLPVHEFATVSGLYVATDPVISRAFGGVGGVWAMIEIVLDRGFRFVDVRQDTEAQREAQRFPPELNAALEQAGCHAQFASSLLIMLESRNCREIAVGVVKLLGVNGILHDFPRKKMQPCTDRIQGGFIVLDSLALRNSETRSAVAESRSSDRMRVHEMFVRARREGSRLPLPWADLTESDTAPDMDGWMHEHIFGCGQYPEDEPAAMFSPLSVDALYDAAQSEMREGRPRNAIRLYRDAIAKDPDYIPAMDGLAWILATDPRPELRNPPEAQRLATRLFDLIMHKFRNSANSTPFSKAYKVHTADTVAVAFASNRDFTHAVDCATVSVETARRIQETQPSEIATKLLSEAEDYLKLFQAERPLVGTVPIKRTEVPLH